MQQTRPLWFSLGCLGLISLTAVAATPEESAETQTRSEAHRPSQAPKPTRTREFVYPGNPSATDKPAQETANPEVGLHCSSKNLRCVILEKEQREVR
jgi:hypothetical protein